MKIIVVGAGIFGVTISLTLSENGYDVTLVECEDDILKNASKSNHNRLHFGFHYPRSINTAKQSLDGYELFYNNFEKSILKNFPNYYLIEKNGKVSKEEFKLFCDNLNVYYNEKFPENINVNQNNITYSVLTNEPVFDYFTLKNDLKGRVKTSKIKLYLNKKIVSINDLSDYDIVINTTYSNVNKINNLFGIAPLKIKLQDVIVPIFEMVHPPVGLTIMDGDYCSIMPKGFEENKFLLYHVKESVINQVEDYEIPSNWGVEDDLIIDTKISKIYESSSIYYPFLKSCKKLSYWRTTRALPINDNDERLSSLQTNFVDNKLVVSLLSGKITTCWLMSNKILNIINEHTVNR